MKKFFYFTIILSAGFMSACKKDKKTQSASAVNNAIKDSIFYYAKEANLWFEQLPTYDAFKPQSFTDPDLLTSLQKEVDALSQYPINPATGKPYEYYSPSPGLAKYSFVDDGTETAALNGTKGDFGFDYNYNGINDIRVLYVYPGSPAANAGLTRGCQITGINDDTDLSYDGLSNGQPVGTGTSAHNNFVYNSIFNSGSIKLTFTTLAGASVTKSFSTTSYTVNPVLKDTVLDLGSGKKIGYVVFNSFTAPDNAGPKLQAALSDFSTQGVSDLVVDLRYNGGGYVSTAEYLDSLIVPSAKTGTVMYKSTYNSTITAGKEVLLKKQVYRDASGLYTLADELNYLVANNTVYFGKIGSLNVSRVFFIVTGGTASASELTINNLIPNMDVELIGETTYGKPVGFFGININKYALFTPEFSTQNSAGQGGYYTGMTPGVGIYKGVSAQDDYTKDFGDPTEGLLAQAVNKVKTGAYLASTRRVVQSTSAARLFSAEEATSISISHNKRRFTGMIFNRSIKVKK